MALSIGIVGLPNVGKSTLFNALTRSQIAEAANYAFCTIEPNSAVVPVPDPRVEELAEMVRPEKTIHATVVFTDIAGLVEGASRGEGLGNQFLAHIRESNAIVHVVRCFEDEEVSHVHGTVNPVRDISVIETELLLADIQTVEKRIDKLQRQVTNDKSVRPLLDLASALQSHLSSGDPASTFEAGRDQPSTRFCDELFLLTAKPVIYCANVGEGALQGEDPPVSVVRDYARERGAIAVTISARIEDEISGLEDEERSDFLRSYGVTDSGLDQVIRGGYAALDLISFLTAGPKEVRAWTVPRGTSAPAAAGAIHSDFERGFIRAEVIAYEDFVRHGSETACRAAGVARVEGRDYVIEDGDVVHFRFNV
ncbi:MAG: redox-regulated ATPase YchF [Candidatus Binatia bacterium]